MGILKLEVGVESVGPMTETGESNEAMNNGGQFEGNGDNVERGVEVNCTNDCGINLIAQ